jgi:hypothetical protein
MPSSDPDRLEVLRRHLVEAACLYMEASQQTNFQFNEPLPAGARLILGAEIQPPSLDKDAALRVVE